MRIEAIGLANTPPIREFNVSTASSVVVIAGANGSGKTRLKEAIANTFRAPGSPSAALRLVATRPEEETAWGAKTVNLFPGQSVDSFVQYMQARTRGNTYVGTAVQIDSDRSVQNLKFQTWGFATPDPDDEEVAFSYYLSPFGGRWSDLMNKIHQKLASRDNKLARFVKDNLPDLTLADALKANPDPFLTYQETFAKLLPGKSLERIDPQSPRVLHYRNDTSKPMPFNTLSSGEQEVVKVAFDLVSRRSRHSVIMIDEPELHLHPTLTFRLLETLKSLGEGTNQLILFTHSADLISTYWSSGNVFFIDTSSDVGNQARQLGDLAAAHASTAQAAGANLGLFAVGKHLIFIEGQHLSVDRAVYHRVAQRSFADAYLLPLGSVSNLMALRTVVGELDHEVFGIRLYMVRDRDGLSEVGVTELESHPRFRCLPRRHIENYLLDEDVLTEVAKQLYLDPILRDTSMIAAALREVAQDTLMLALLASVREWIRMRGALAQPKIKNVQELTLNQFVDQLSTSVALERGRVNSDLDDAAISAYAAAEHARLTQSIVDGTWRDIFPGKQLFHGFCGKFWHHDAARVREAYADIAFAVKPAAFSDVSAIFSAFAALPQ